MDGGDATPSASFVVPFRLLPPNPPTHLSLSIPVTTSFTLPDNSRSLTAAMAFIRTRGSAILLLDSSPASLPPYRRDHNPSTHQLFTSEISTLNTKELHRASVSIPKVLLPDDLSLEGPVRVEGPLTVHLLDGMLLEFRLDVEWIDDRGYPLYNGHLHAEFILEPGSEPVFTTGDREAWVVNQLHPIKQQFWSVPNILTLDMY